MISVMKPVTATRVRIYLEEDTVRSMLGVHIQSQFPLSDSIVSQLHQISILAGITQDDTELRCYILARDHRNIECIIAEIMLIFSRSGYLQATNIEGYSTRDLFKTLKYTKVPTTIETCLAAVEFETTQLPY